MKKLLTFSLFFFLILVSSQTVYYTPSGERYHNANCRMVKNVSNKTELNSALEKGLIACKICKPISNSTLKMVGTKKTSGSNATVRCKGTTKSGNRCQHKTRIGNGYCFQHQP